MTLAKKGCEVALLRAYKVRHEQRGGNRRGVAEATKTRDRYSTWMRMRSFTAATTEGLSVTD